MNKFYKKIIVFCVIFAMGIMYGSIMRMRNTISTLNSDVVQLNQICNDTSKQLITMNQKVILLNQEVGEYRINSKHVDMYDIETPRDHRYYQYIKDNNSYSNPLSEDEIWDIVAALKNVKNPTLILALAKAESSFNIFSISKAGCIGLMQINPIHAKQYNFKKSDLFDPVRSIEIADQLIADWQKNGKLSTLQICKKYLGCHSDSYLGKIKKNLREI